MENSSKSSATSNGDQAYNEYFTQLKAWVTQFKEQEKQAFIFAQSMNNFGMPTVQNASNVTSLEVYECKLAPLWKRFCAEVIDQVILTIIQFYIINILHYGFDISFVDYQNFLLLTSFSAELAIVEFASRIMLFFYESYFLSVDYATPGKKILGLKVVRIEVILEVPGRETIYAMPCHRLGWWHAFFRSILKNVGVLMFPICYGFMLTRYGRSGYDYITKTLVIDTARQPMRDRKSVV